MSRRGAAAAAAGFTALVLLATLLPGEAHPPNPGSPARLLPEDFLSDAVRNLLLFLPLGLLLRRAGRSAAGAVASGAALSAFVEGVQILVPFRHPSVLDLLCNTAGAGLGAWLSPRLSHFLDPEPPRAAAFARRWSTAVALFLAAQGPLAAPALPPLPWFAGLRPEFGHLIVYPGEVREASVGDEALAPGRIPRAAAVRDLVARGAPIRLRATAGPAPPPGVAPLLTLHGDRQTLALAVGVEGADLVFEVRTRARALGLETPALHAPDLLAGLAPGEPFEVRLEPGPDGACATALLEAREPPEVRRHCRLGLRPGDGWGLFFYAELPPPAWRPALGGLWLALLAVPVGFWPAGLRARVLLPALLTLLIAAVPEVSPLAPARIGEVAAPAAGVAAGLVLRRLRSAGLGRLRGADPGSRGR